MIRISHLLLLCALILSGRLLHAQSSGEEIPDVGWGKIEIQGKEVLLVIDSMPESGFVSLPRLNNRMKSLTWRGMPDGPDLKLQPEPTQWRIEVPKSIDLPTTIRLETFQPVRVATKPVVARPNHDGEIVLPAHDAVTHGEKLRFEPQPHKNTIGYWTDVNDWAEWHFRVDQAGRFECRIAQGCGKGNGGSEVDVICVSEDGSQRQLLPLVVEDTGHFQNFVVRMIGLFDLQPGRYRIEVRPRSKAKAAVCDIRQIKLVPVQI
ncbi:hypothetical protein FYK55_06155 [Roseiconus nitratireducens]|uniref:Uncharacterized protein n=1 Tax=Roseiconus nitratireducens TaxID=2605748 RepID=A0A5M6DCK0_9BACT|nr:hypothetical protein [Roseiconus nitratireducens]KAA5545244.1 hypothetical protein FYK55_06155 [Roseiconus nitratireducens]